ncbi:MAG: type I 3-dehydroquinate dehydratase [Spirochaetaceae bacterium]|jgi:3-dehydroquinate dehydratase/shikimate dehydrogenase|nr:type I 3-dehydroquinate dehydratase [Spirochaetaceae bacterium]
MTKICLCLTGKTIAQDLALIDKYRTYIDIAELRVDCLEDKEYEYIRRFPELAGLPVILTVRRKIDGGCFIQGEAARILLISRGLAFAKLDHRQNFAYVDLEEDLDIPSLEEVVRAFGTRIIRSFHNLHCTDPNLESHLRSLFRVGDEIAKAAVTPHSLDDVRRVVSVAKTLRGRDTIILAMGDCGQCTRILAAKYGGYLTYTSAQAEDNVPSGAPGHIDPIELSERYRFRKMNAATAVYGITGYPLVTTLSPQFHNEVVAREEINAVYVRFPSETIDEFMRFADEIELCGASITVPHKEAVISYLTSADTQVAMIGACNTIIRTDNGWRGWNTDASGFSGSFLATTNRKDFKRMKVTVIGAGGAARAILAEIARLGGKVLLLNRNLYRARQLAEKYHFEYGLLDDRDSLRRIKKFSNIIVQTTSVGMEPDIYADPLPNYDFTGKEVVMDIIYKPEHTAFLSRALDAGCTVINGYDMLIRQAKYQFEHFFGRKYPEIQPKP